MRGRGVVSQCPDCAKMALLGHHEWDGVKFSCPCGAGYNVVGWALACGGARALAALRDATEEPALAWWVEWACVRDWMRERTVRHRYGKVPVMVAVEDYCAWLAGKSDILRYPTKRKAQKSLADQLWCRGIHIKNLAHLDGTRRSSFHEILVAPGGRGW